MNAVRSKDALKKIAGLRNRLELVRYHMDRLIDVIDLIEVQIDELELDIEEDEEEEEEEEEDDLAVIED